MKMHPKITTFLKKRMKEIVSPFNGATDTPFMDCHKNKTDK